MVGIVLALALSAAPRIVTKEGVAQCVAAERAKGDAQEDARTEAQCRRKLRRAVKTCGGDEECCQAWNAAHGTPGAECEPYTPAK